MNPRRALITGITGQDGSYLAEFLLAKGYDVHGIVRRSSTFGTERIEHIYQDPHEAGKRLTLHYGDLCDANGLSRIISNVKPTEVYNVGAQSHVKVSFEQPLYTGDATGLGAAKLLEAVREYQDDSGYEIRYYQASTSEMFGGMPESAPQSEDTPFHPRSPYGVAKLYAHWLTVNY
ncbi:MAG: GDP-mannose 4,6-dehydratase, partial [Planctomycetota bacterium]